MPSFFPLFPPSGTRTFRAACVVLAGVALAQGVAFGVAWRGNQQPAAPERSADARKSPPRPAAPSVASEFAQSPGSAEPENADPFASALPFEETSGNLSGNPLSEKAEKAAAAALLPAPPLLESVPGAPAPVPAVAVMARPAVKTAAPLDIPITDEVCLRHLDEGIYLRGRGDMQGALVELRAALALSPDHPQLLYQTARTLDMMIQEQKSLVLWEKLKKLGPGAGNCYQLALIRLKELSGITPASAADTEDEEEKGGRFVLGEVTAERLADTVNGEVLRFHTSVKRLQKEPVDVVRIWIKLHLFDMVNGGRIARTTAVVKAEAQWLDQPVDWADGVERFDFEYRQPPLSADEIVKLGQRKYYGYAVELRYGDEGQEKFEDMVAEPRELANFARELPEETGPPDVSAPAAVPGQPDGTLFPGDQF